ncbi:MAG: hypothetical protein D3910_11405, partial [Candidatus Electrothrix sp. ATG2]|nr:hypothetical protein [Candidatus Electrothrix sp. ATG2]
MSAKHNLRQIFADKEILEEIQNSLGSGPRRTELQAKITDGSEATLDRLLSGDEGPINETLNLTEAEAIILAEGRPPLLIQDNKWEKPR